MANLLSDTGTRAGTIGGTMLSVFPSISSGDLIRTVVLATIGAVVSYLVSVMMKRVFERIKKK